MLLELGFRNFFSFREGARVSFRLDSNCPESIAGGRDFVTVMGVKGANAAGKTHVLKALSFLSRFTASSFSTDPDSLMPFSSFFDNSDPTELYVEFKAKDGREYRYEVELTDRKIIRESIYRTLKRSTLYIERIENEITKPKTLAGIDGLILRDNVSIISMFNQYARPELADVYRFFRGIVTNVGFLGYNDIPLDINRAAELFHKHPKALDFAKNFIKDCDTGVEDIEIDLVESAQNKIKDGKPEPEKEYRTFFTHLVDGERKYTLVEAESSGTKSLFRILGLYAAVLASGGIAVYDEFDLHLHPHIIPKILGLFTDGETNLNGSQLIVSSHDDRIMDILGRYRTILVNKEENESYLYRLDEIPGDLVRNDRTMLPAYHEGKLGGVPRI